MIKGVIFDLDGVVVNTVSIHFKAWKRMFNEYGKEFTFQDYKEKVDGIPRIDGTKAILTDLNEEKINEAARKKQNYFRQVLDSDEIPIYQSTVNFIHELKENNIPRAVISSSKNCTHILKRTNIYNLLNSVIDGSKITKGKPDPQIFLMAADALNIAPENCLVFEDAVLGVKAAKNARMYCVGIDRYSNPRRLNEADLIITDVSDISLQKLLNLF